MDRRDILRAGVKGVYDLQDLRIRSGQRLAANFRSKLGYDQAQKEEEDEEAQEVLKELRQHYQRITDGIVAEGSTLLSKAAGNKSDKKPGKGVLSDEEVKKRITARNFKGDELISSYAEYVITEQYIALLREEEKQMRGLLVLLQPFEIWKWLDSIRGIGPAMAGCIISEFDISRAKYPSSLWAYAGLDTVMVCPHCGQVLEDRIITGTERDIEYVCRNAACTLFNQVVKEPRGEGRSRKAHHLRTYDYTDSEGNVKQKKGLTYNPWLKTKLFVLANSFIRTGNVKYRSIYNNYRARLDNRPDLNEESKKHKQMMSLRYMVKMFLIDLYNEWRKLEGLEVFPDYPTAKLKLNHGGPSDVPAKL